MTLHFTRLLPYHCGSSGSSLSLRICSTVMFCHPKRPSAHPDPITRSSSIALIATQHGHLLRASKTSVISRLPRASCHANPDSFQATKGRKVVKKGNWFWSWSCCTDLWQDSTQGGLLFSRLRTTTYHVRRPGRLSHFHNGSESDWEI